MKKLAGLFAYAIIVTTGSAVDIQTPAIPSGDVGLPYNAVLSAANGTAPYSWSWSEGGIAGYTESIQSNSFAEVGTAQGWQSPYTSWNLQLPFEFPFLNKNYSSVQVYSDGQILLEEDNVLDAQISVLSGGSLDLSGGDIYVESTPSEVTIRWVGQVYSAYPVSFSVTLSKGGSITMKYGNGNAYGGDIGIYSGYIYLPSTFSYSGSMDNAADIVYKPVLAPGSSIAGLSLSSGGIISGTPSSVFSNRVTVGVSDAGGDVGISFLNLLIYDDRDDDGMLDAWERTIVDHNLSDGVATIYDVLRDGNYDGDSFSNIEEYLLGYDPVVPDGDPLDTVEEGLELMARALTNDVDSTYLSMIDACFEAVIAADPTNYDARVYRAASRLINLINNEDLRLFLEESGGSLGYDLELTGAFELTDAPVPDIAVDRICSNLLPALEASFADLEFIPTNWNGTVELSTNYFQMDETVYADVGDVTSVMSALKLLRSKLLMVKAQSLNVDYDKLQVPCDGPLASIIVDGDAGDWSAVPAQLMGEHGSGIGVVKAARSASSVYLLISHSMPVDGAIGMSADISLGLDSGMDVQLQPYWYGSGGTNVWFDATQSHSSEVVWVSTNGLIEMEIPVPSGIAVSNVCVLDFVLEHGIFDPSFGFMVSGEESVGGQFSTPVDVFFSNHPDFMQAVRSGADMAEAKVCLQHAFDLSQLADVMIKSRTDTLMHFIEYDPASAADRSEFFGRLQQVEDSLGAPLFVAPTNSVGELLAEETVHFGAFYQPDYITRAMLPEFWQVVGQPMVDTLPDPTFGGILPNMTQAKLMAYFRQGGEDGLDWDGDGLPNGWEYLYGGHPTNLNASADNDGDGCSNAHEYLAGTNPTNSASCFSAIFDASDAFRMVISWQAAEDRVYDIHWSPGLGENFQLLEAGIGYPQNTYTDTVHTASAAGFFRIVARMPGPDDLDADGLPDDWEGFHFSSYSPNPDDDTDHDGRDNISEYIAGSNPADGASFFAVSDVRSGSSGFMVEWISMPDRSYSVKWAPAPGAPFQTLEEGIAYPSNSFTDTLHRAESAGFYKVDVEMK